MALMDRLVARRPLVRFGSVVVSPARVASVALLYHPVRRGFGPAAGLIAALALALTPVSVAINRANELDGLLVFVVLLAAWAVSLAAERGRLRLLLLCATLVGLGFNVKM